MRTIQEVIEPTSKRKKMDQFCGRLIIWDAGTPQDNLIVMATDYYHAKPDFSKQNGPKPYTSLTHVPETASSPPSSLKPIAQRFYQRYGFLPGYISKKPLLN